MLKREYILANVQNCSVKDLVEAILNTTVSMYELKSCGLLPKQQELVKKALKSTSEGNISSNNIKVDGSQRQFSGINTSHANEDNDDFPSEITVDNDPYNTDGSATVVSVYNQSSNVFFRPFSFKGRVKRRWYWVACVVTLVWFLGLLVSYVNSYDEIYNRFFYLTLVLGVPILWSYLAQAVKRCHDRRASGWWLLVPFYCIWLLFADSK